MISFFKSKYMIGGPGPVKQFVAVEGEVGVGEDVGDDEFSESNLEFIR